MENRYKETIAYKSIEKLKTKTELETRKRKVLEGIRYHRENNNDVLANSFFLQYEHIENRLKTFY